MVLPGSGAFWLMLGAGLSSIAAIMHIGIIFGGGDWYRFFGAGEQMAQAAESGKAFPAIVTVGIAATLSIWALFASVDVYSPSFIRWSSLICLGYGLVHLIGVSKTWSTL